MTKNLDRPRTTPAGTGRAPAAKARTGTADPAEPTAAALPDGAAARRSLAVLRIALGGVFLWTFLDKLFGLGRSTPRDGAWIDGGTPSQGYMRHGARGPLADVFAGAAGPVTDVLFMAGMLGVGLALVLGIGLRVAAGAAVAMMALLYLSTWPFPAGSQNFLLDNHVVYAAAAVALAACGAGATWGLGARWTAIPFVARRSWLA